MAAVTATRAPKHLKVKRKAGHTTKGQVEFNSDDNMVYNVPLDSCTQSPMPTLSCSSDSNKSKFLDEIALLKRGKITRDTPRSTYKRGLSSEDPNKAPIDDDKPITLAELNTRGLQVDDQHIIYTFPDATASSDGDHESHSSKRSVVSSESGRKTILSSLKSGEVREYNVGYPNENATLRISSLSHNGQSYELSTDSDVCVLQEGPKNVVLITWKN